MSQPGKAQKQVNPIIDGETVTITWSGNTPPHLISDLHGWEENPQPLTELKKGVWAISFSLPLNAYLEYAFYEPASKARIPDPLNSKSVYNGVGGHNQFFYMPAAQPTPYIKLPDGGLRGKVTRHTVPARFVTTSNSRRIYLYHPPVTQAVPLLVVYDGLDYFRRGRLTEIVDNLIAARRISPVAVAFCQNAGPARMVEYGCAEPTLGFLLSQVLPLASSEIHLVDLEKQPGAHAVMGASMGGLMSVFTALNMPQVFGKAISQAGAFELWEHETMAMKMVRYFPRPPVKLWLDCGTLDFLLPANRKMNALLLEKGYDVTYQESGGAHNYTTWRNSCARALEVMFA
jgi:enterochelin esterase family protein